jgi:CubicO group peptidase (beta-lactamase class C family)
MMLNGGTLDGKRLLSRKTVELMTNDQLGRISPETAFGLGFGVYGVKSPLAEAGSPGQYGWGGFFYTQFFIDPKEQMIGVFMAQLHPTGGLTLDRLFQSLAYQAIVD